MRHTVLNVNPGKLLGPFMQVKSKLEGHSERVTGLAFSSALNVLISSGADAQVSI